VRTDAPSRLVMKGGCRVYCYTPHRELTRVIERARHRGEEKVLIDGRGIPLDRIVKVLAPTEVTQ